MSEYELFFEIFTPMDFHVRVTASYWNDSNGKTSCDEWTKTTGKKSS